MSSGRRAVALRPGQLLAVGGMLFSMFFGAGNLILPPLLGLQAGDQAIPAMTGFLIAGIGLPVLGIVAVAVCGGVRELAGRVSPLFASVFIALMYLTIGPFLAIPRTSSTAFEMLRPLLPVTDAAGLGVATAAFSVAFFGVAFALALRPGLLSRVLGRFSAPALILLIVLVVGASVLGGAPAPTAPQPPYDASPLSNGFLTGYQTMDLLAALCFGIVVAANVRELGVSDPKRVAGSISGAGLIAGALMMAIYCGLAFVGSAMGSTMPDAANGASILAASASAHFGPAGTVIVAAIFLLACLNVCTGLDLVLLGVLLRGFSAYPASGVGGGVRRVQLRGVAGGARCHPRIFRTASGRALSAGHRAGGHGPRARALRPAAAHVALRRAGDGGVQRGRGPARRVRAGRVAAPRCASACRRGPRMACGRHRGRGGGRDMVAR